MIRAKLFIDGVWTQLTADERIVLRMEDGISFYLDDDGMFEARYFYPYGGSSMVAKGDASPQDSYPSIRVNESWGR